ncbi:uncharacterized protein LOC100902935 isoform X2 [Galendromus occidentalis]|uniref:Uncharacterized protein LOC100902935 isoform X2 n=1 Tax=Galendromus occidentalis TaxID=34638 RepID=A0AAJ6QTK9_9ACAR|nr:uncharacterized protein LOC100902935 isoform X2 [Galendromus occidentalis]
MITAIKAYNVIAFVAAVLTMMSRSSPLISSDGMIRRQMPVEDAANSTLNITENLLFNDTKGVAKPLAAFGEEERCDTEPFCETDEHPVPDEVQLKVLEENFDKLRAFFEKDDTDTPQLYRTSQLLDSQSPSFVQACDTQTKIIDRLKKVRDIDGNPHFLLNPDQGGYRQWIYYVRCREERGTCTNVEAHLPPNRQTYCATRLWRRVMTAINVTSYEPYEILVDVPGACTCYIKAQI